MKDLKHKVVEETRQLLFLTLYLALFLNSLTIYKNLLLKQNIFSFFHIGYNFIEALLLAKIIMIGNMLKIGEKYSKSPLIITTLYKALTFSLFLFIFMILEHVFFALFEGKTLTLAWQELPIHNLNQDLGRLFISFLFLTLLFSFLELSRTIGNDRTYALFFHRSKDE